MVDKSRNTANMKGRKQPSAKVLDISRPKKRATSSDASSAPSLIIPKRSSLIIPVSEDDAGATETAAKTTWARRAAKNIAPQTAPPLPNTEPESQPAPAKPDQELLAPEPPEPAQPAAEQTMPVQTAPTQPRVEPEPQPALEPEPEPEPEPGLTPQTDSKPQPTQTKPAAEPSPQPEPQPAEKPVDTANKSPELEGPGANTKPAKAKAAEHKSLEEAQRQEEIQGYIDRREFFVPINAQARKRSLKVSIALIFVELLLGLFLLNLMLDAGLIYLLEKIPHTNFFNLQ